MRIMGIPGYFVDLLKRNRKVLQLLQEAKKVDVLCVDANGIIYEVVRHLEQKEHKSAENNQIRNRDRLGALSPEAAALRIAPLVTNELARLPELMSVTDEYFVAFDGIAPNAKIAQQRQRRYGRLIQNKAMREVRGGSVISLSSAQPHSTPLAIHVPPFDTTQITPATPFMTALMPLLKEQLTHAIRLKFRFSGSDEPGEGEHKIMKLCRQGIWQEKDVVVHGLDADLILLALANQHQCGSLRLAREAPSFIKHLDKTMDPHATYILDIPRFAKVINRAMGGAATENLASTDYVFMMSMLGNDFMPHQPAISIRDNGIERVCRAYKACRGADSHFTLLAGEPLVPHWRNVGTLLKYLGEQEDQVMSKFAKRRAGFAHQASFPPTQPSGAKPNDLEAIWNQLPQLQIGLENFIAAGTTGWRERYYQHMLGDMVNVTPVDDGSEHITSPWLEVNTERWLQGLQWVWEYYTSNDANWHWVYAGSHPPPLLQELARLGRFDDGDDKLCKWRETSEPMTNAEQLARVLPPCDVDGNWILPSVELHWQYCRHGWEAELLA